MSDCLELIQRNQTDLVTIDPHYQGPISLTIGGLSIQLNNQSSIPLAFNISYREFLEMKSGSLQIDTFDGEPSLPNDLQPKVSVPKFWSIDSNGASQVFRLFYNESDVIHQTLMVDSNYTSGQAYDDGLSGDKDLIAPFRYPMDLLLFSKLLTINSGFILHGCAMVLDGKAYVFSGRKGAENNTIGRLWLKRGATILGDEQIILRLQDGKVWVYGSPWSRKASECVNEKYAVEAIYCIDHGEMNQMTPMLPAGAVRALFSKIYMATAFKEDVPVLLSTCQQIASLVPTSLCHCVPEDDSVELALSLSR
jgi:hypothetical protein